MRHILKKDLIVQSNALVEACYKLTLQEARIILFLASRIEPDDSDFKDYEIPVKELAEIAQIDSSSLYSTMIGVTDTLLKKVFKVKKEDGKTEQFAWLCAAIHNPRSGSITLRFDKELKPYLLKLKKNFTSFSLSVAIKFKNIFSFRIYELLKQYESIGKREISIDDLRWMLDLDDNTYPLYGNFKQRVIKPIQKELKEKSDIYFDFDEIKRGRSINAIRFIIHKQPFPSDQQNLKNAKAEAQEEAEDVFINELVELLPKEYQKLASYKKMLIKYFDKNGKNYVVRNILYANDKSNKINYRAYLSKSLENDYGLAYQEDQEIKKEEAKRQKEKAINEAKQKELEYIKVQKERDNREKARKMIAELSEEEKSALEIEALEQLKSPFKERYERNHNDSIGALQMRLTKESIIMQRHPEEFK